MGAETYGEHQEAAAAALNRLIVTDVIPIDPGEIDHLLQCREAVSDALKQRLYGLGLNAHHAPGPLPATISPDVKVAKLDKNLATMMDRIALDMPTPQEVSQRSPIDVLGTPSRNETVELWRESAIELLAGSHALDSAAERPWLSDQGAGWYLMRDVAVSIEAFMVLDSRLEEVGLLNVYLRPDPGLGLEQRRLIASQCARTATWHATSDSPDLAAPVQPGASAIVGPGHVVSQPSDLAIAQRRLAEHLRPMHASDSFYLGEPAIDATTARLVMASQTFLTRRFEAIAERTSGTQEIRAEFSSRRETLQDAQTAMAYLIDDEDRGRNMRVVWQQGELTTAIGRMSRTGVDMRMSPAQLLNLANATHEVTHAAAKATRRELLRETGNLRLADPTWQIGMTRVHRGHPLERVLTDMTNAPPPTKPVAQYANPLQRAALRQTLDVTPTSRPPNPYPQARGHASNPRTY